MKRKPLVFVGAGGLGKELAWLVRRVDAAGTRWNLTGYVDAADRAGQLHAELPIVGDDPWLLAQSADMDAVIAIGAPERVASVAELYQRASHLSFPDIIDPCAVVDLRVVRFGGGCVVFPSVVFTAAVTVGRHVLFNPGCTVSHDCVIGDFTALSPGVRLAGAVSVGSRVLLGASSTVLPGVHVGDRAIVGAGSVVTQDVPPGCVVAGVPAKPIRRASREA